MRARDLARCLVFGHEWAELAPTTCRRCAGEAGGYDPATPENVLAQLDAALGPWPPQNGPEVLR